MARGEVAATCLVCEAFVTPRRLRSAFRWANRHVLVAHPEGYTYAVRRTEWRKNVTRTTRWVTRGGSDA